MHATGTLAPPELIRQKSPTGRRGPEGFKILQNISNFATGYFDCTCYQFKSTAGGIQLDLIRLMQSIVVLVIRPFTHRFTHASEGFTTAFKNCSIYNDFKTRKVRNTTKRVGLSNHDKEKYFQRSQYMYIYIKPIYLSRRMN